MKTNIFEKRINAKPFEYPQFMDYVDSIHHAYWLHTEFNLTPDIHDYFTNITEQEKQILTRCVLAISQIEVAVKRFWGDLYHMLPKPEIDLVGATFADSEARHFLAYQNILEKLHLESEFEKISTMPALNDRYNYLEKIMADKEIDPKKSALKILLFAELIERISLFGMFYVIMSFNKRKNLFKGLSNTVEATSKEEEIHGMFGIEIFNIICEENPAIFNQEFKAHTLQVMQEGHIAEQKIIDWMFEGGDLEHCSKAEVMNFINLRFNEAMLDLDVDYRFPQDPTLDQQNLWFIEELRSTKEKDFFNKRVTDYSKGTQSITADDLF